MESVIHVSEMDQGEIIHIESGEETKPVWVYVIG